MEPLICTHALTLLQMMHVPRFTWHEHEYKVRVDSNDVQKAGYESSSIVGICPPGTMEKTGNWVEYGWYLIDGLWAAFVTSTTVHSEREQYNMHSANEVITTVTKIAKVVQKHHRTGNTVANGGDRHLGDQLIGSLVHGVLSRPRLSPKSVLWSEVGGKYGYGDEGWTCKKLSVICPMERIRFTSLCLRMLMI